MEFFSSNAHKPLLGNYGNRLPAHQPSFLFFGFPSICLSQNSLTLGTRLSCKSKWPLNLGGFQHQRSVLTYATHPSSVATLAPITFTPGPKWWTVSTWDIIASICYHSRKEKGVQVHRDLEPPPTSVRRYLSSAFTGQNNSHSHAWSRDEDLVLWQAGVVNLVNNNIKK